MKTNDQTERFFPGLFEGVAELMRAWRIQNPDATSDQELAEFMRILGGYANGQ